MSYLLVHIQLPEDLGGVEEMGVIHNPNQYVSTDSNIRTASRPHSHYNIESEDASSVEERTF